MTEFEDVKVYRGDDGIPRDHLGRYRMPDPETGKTRSWTRATTIAGTLADRYALEKWDNRNIVWGMGQKPALVVTAAAATLKDVKTLDKVAARAREAADSKAGADIGTAIHTFAERVDRGEDAVIPEPYDRDIAAYRKACEMAGIATCVGWIERVVVVPEIGTAGTLDRLVNGLEFKLPRIGDIKSASDKSYNGKPPTNTILTYGMVEIPLQLSIYAHASHWWDQENEQWVEMPVIDQDKGLVMHIPAGLGECRIYEIDIAAGWEAVQHAMWSRAWRKRKDLAETLIVVKDDGTLVAGSEGDSGESTGAVGTGKDGEGVSPSPEDPPAPPPPTFADEFAADLFQKRHAWGQQRVNAIKASTVEHDGVTPIKRLAGLWSLKDDIPRYPKGGPRTMEELEVVLGFCSLVEMEFSLPFPDEPDPGAPEPPKQQRRKGKR